MKFQDVMTSPRGALCGYVRPVPEERGTGVGQVIDRTAWRAEQVSAIGEHTCKRQGAGLTPTSELLVETRRAFFRGEALL
jgi:hypothetical protein